MGPEQCVPARDLGMIEVSGVPCALAVAKDARGGVAGPSMFVLIVRLMAGHTILRVGGLEAKAATLDVAGAALEVPVGTPKLISA